MISFGQDFFESVCHCQKRTTVISISEHAFGSRSCSWRETSRGQFKGEMKNCGARPSTAQQSTDCAV